MKIYHIYGRAVVRFIKIKLSESFFIMSFLRKCSLCGIKQMHIFLTYAICNSLSLLMFYLYRRKGNGI